MAVPKEIIGLVEKFEQNRDSYTQGGYNEAQVRAEFIDPFFRALGWDVDNTSGLAEAYKDVIHEDTIRIGSAVKAPDCCFRIGGTRKFFLEAKKPAVNIKEDPEPAYQLRRYAWSAKLPLSILTDFEEFAVYDCRVRPKQGDKAAIARVMYLRYTDYVQRWDEIASIFSKDAILKGSFDKYAQTEKRKRGTAEVDAAFLAEIEEWRDKLAHNIALRNPNLSNRQLNFAVQVTIDRIIFLRICEDRGIERYAELAATTNGIDVYQRLMALFRKADDRYNSGLFHFSSEKDRPEGPDELTPSLTIDDKPLKEIIRSLYYPESPYAFSVLPAEILGQVYEQFLGKVITLTAGHHARVEEKPEVKKAGGVFYTPSYIVDYIVKQTVGKLLEGRSVTFFKTKPPKLDRPLRVLDPACGSGSFLLGAYQLLLDWYRDYYVRNEPQKWAATKTPPIHQANGGWKLTLSERKRILLDHIFGVDIDTQAVEVTKLSLLLRVLEGEKDLNLFHNERALPDLAANIKCGNSLIGPDFYSGQQLTMFDKEERLRINAFDWHTEFPYVFKDGGFDAVIGNPPYVRVQLVGHDETDYLFKSYESASSKIDLSVFFLEKAFDLIAEQGIVGLITTKQWMSTDYGSGIRSILSRGRLRHLLDFGSLPVFANADTYPAILVCQRKKTRDFSYGLVESRDSLNIESLSHIVTIPIDVSRLGTAPWNLSGFDLTGIARSRGFKVAQLIDFGHVYIGDLTGMDEAFVLKCEDCDKQSLKSGLLFPYAYRGAEVFRYSETKPQSFVIYPYFESDGGNPALLSEDDFRKRAPKLHEHLLAHKAKLRQRMDSRRLYATHDWYRHLRPGNFAYIHPEKLIFKGIDTRLSVGLLGGHSVFNGANTPAFIPENLGHTSLLYLLAVLNSRLIGFYLVRVCPPKLGGYTRFNSTNINATPIRIIDFSDKSDRAVHDRMAALAQQMLGLHKQLADTKTPHEKMALERQIAATDEQIDRLVYELYGLTDDEIKIVEEATR